MANVIRVRPLLNALNSIERSDLKKLLPKGVSKAPAEPEGTRYPAALLAALPKDESYALLGHISEALLRLPPAEVTPDTLIATVRVLVPDFTDEAKEKLFKSKTTEPFLEHIRQTRKKLRFVAQGTLLFDQIVGDPHALHGHPDMVTATQIFEVKMTGQLDKGWPDFLLQTFAYAALAQPSPHSCHIVLPLQEIVWSYDVTKWTNREAFAAAIQAAAAKKVAGSPTAAAARLLCAYHHIGSHRPKMKSLAITVASFPESPVPSQIFLSGPQSSKCNIADAELAATAAVTDASAKPWFVHSPYIINLCTPPGEKDDYHTACLTKQLKFAAAAGARGVVVHVGKSTDQPLETALAHMRANLQTAMAAATPQCPVLLETPAGQGTEVLTTTADFVEFVQELTNNGADPRLRICVDTCHVFATGSDPVSYLQAVPVSLLSLVHFNDSATPCGSRLDRHAFCGEGHIGLAKMTEVAHICTNAAIPMVVE